MKNKIIPFISILCLVCTIFYLAKQFFTNYLKELGSEFGSSEGFIKYIIGLIISLGVIILIAYLNYRFVFRKLIFDSKKQWFYWIWISFFSILIFNFLEFRTFHDPEYVDENVVLTLTLILFIIIFAYIADYFRTKREQLELMKQKADAELGMLKAQINPHFLFNCLNLVYSSAFREGAEETAETVQKLSSILRFSVEESKREKTSIEKELDFIEKYVSLQKVRLPKRENIQTKINIEWDEKPAVIVPLLIVPFIENAFQYAISTEQPSFIHLDLNVKDKRMNFNIENSIPIKNNKNKKGTETGIENTKKRLELSYPNRHLLKIEHKSDVFKINLMINL